MPLPNVAPKVRVRGMILTIGITAITIVGTMAGAGLKSDIETKESLVYCCGDNGANVQQQKKKMIVEPTGEDDLIAALEARRLGLVQARATWEKKAETLRERIESKAKRNIGGESGSGTGTASSGK
ncbi:hypothetical protein SBRCBS47491_005079 [Sporothrix bragantina]|uniref:Uncharacterized protein n=1 Tax=Sporothrix bragantina TaxID=671064 RepID=A0ABP0BVC5_9PEZI